MNSLNLRVSSVKSGENIKKNSEVRAALIPLPEPYENVIGKVDFVTEFVRLETVPQQVHFVKKIYENSYIRPDVLRFLSDLVFYSPLKHPVRNQIIKLFNNPLGETISTMPCAHQIINSLEYALTAYLDRIFKAETCDVWNELIVSVSGCFSNFPLGATALSSIINTFFIIPLAAVHRFMNNIVKAQSPCKRNELYLYLHNALRFLLACLQEFKFDDKFDEKLHLMDTACHYIVEFMDAPMETRSNAALVCLQLARHFRSYEKYITKVNNLNKPEQLMLMTSVLKSFVVTEYLQYSAFIRDICKKVAQMGHDYVTVPNILIYAARALCKFSRSLLELPPLTDGPLSNTKLMMRSIFLFSVAHVQHPIDAARQLCREMLRNVIIGARRIGFTLLLNKVYTACSSDTLTLPGKCVLLQQCVGVLGAANVMQNCPYLFRQIFDKNLGRDNAVDNVYAELMIASYTGTRFSTWSKQWIYYLLDIATLRDARLPAVEAILAKATKMDTRVVALIFSRTELGECTKMSALWTVRKMGLHMNNFPEVLKKFSPVLGTAMLTSISETRIMALRVMIETSRTTEALSDFECQNITTYIEYNANCPDPAVRQKAHALIGKSLARTEQLLLRQNKQRLSIDDPLTPSVHLTYLKDIMRISIEHMFPCANYSRRWMSLQLLQQCLGICQRLKFKYEKLLPTRAIYHVLSMLNDSYEGNKATAVSILKQLETQISNDSLIKHYNLPMTIKSIVGLLKSLRPPDSATGAYQLDFFCYSATTKDIWPCEVKVQYPTMFSAMAFCMLELAQGMKVAKRDLCLAAKNNPMYGLLFAIRHLLKQLKFEHFQEEPTWRRLICNLVQICKDVTTIVAPIVNSASPEGHIPESTEQAMKDTKEQSTESATTTKTTAKKDEKQQEGEAEGDVEGEGEGEAKVAAEKEAASKEEVIETTPTEAEAAAESVEVEVATTSANAGNAANTKVVIQSVVRPTVAPLITPIQHCRVTEEQLANIKTTPQLVLLCAWRCVKEVTLLLGDLSQRAPLQLDTNSQKYILTRAQMVDVGMHFKKLLAEIKHRGAFEQAYVGYSMYCGRLWRVNDPELNSLPMTWLQEILKQIALPETNTTKVVSASGGASTSAKAKANANVNANENSSYDQLCATRRSAGLPFMVQALVISELQVGTTNSLRYAMQKLFELCENKKDAKYTEGRVHALNILRAIFRCSELSETVGEYVARGLHLALDSYAATSWSERNSATLLFSALMTRIFGVQRTKDTENLNIRNRMTGRIFFTRYAKLFDYFLVELDRARIMMKERKTSPKLHALLLVLSRLYPSSLEGAESQLNISQFLPLVSVCSGVPEWHTRVLTAKALVALLDKESTEIMILAKCTQLTSMLVNKFCFDSNKLHGEYVHLQYLYKKLSPPNKRITDTIVDTLTFFATASHHAKNPFILKTAIDTFIQIMEGVPDAMRNNLDLRTLKNLQIFTHITYQRYADNCRYLALLRRSYYLYTFHIERLVQKRISLDNFQLPMVASWCKRRQHMEVLNSMLNIIILLWKKCDIIENDYNEYDFDTQEIVFVNLLSDDMRQQLTIQLKACEKLHNELLCIVNDDKYYPCFTTKAYAALSGMDKFVFEPEDLLERAAASPSNVKTPITLCLLRYARTHSIDFDQWHRIVKYLLEISEPWLSEALRFKSAKILRILAPRFFEMLREKRLALFGDYMRLVIMLLNDDDDDIRDYTSSSILINIRERIEMEHIVATLTQRLLLQNIADFLLESKSTDEYIIQVFHIIADPQLKLAHKDTEATIESTFKDPEIFEPHEANAYYEPVKVVMDWIIVLRSTFHNRRAIEKALVNYEGYIKY